MWKRYVWQNDIYRGQQIWLKTVFLLNQTVHDILFRSTKALISLGDEQAGLRLCSQTTRGQFFFFFEAHLVHDMETIHVFW